MNDKNFLQKIQNQFPKIKIKNSRLITQGWNDDVLVVDKKWVFSFPKANQESDDQLQKELKFLPLLNKRTKVKIPNPYYIPSDKSFFGYKFIPGEALTPENYKKLTQAQKNTLARKIVQFLKDLHSFPLGLAKKCGVGYGWSSQDAIKWHNLHMSLVLEHLSEEEGLWIKRILRNLKNARIKFRSVVTHHDLTIDHIIFDLRKGKFSGIIDFGDVQIADPAEDVGKLWEYGEDFVDLLIKYYQPKDKNFKDRAWKNYVYLCLTNLYFGITMKRSDYWKRGYRIFEKMR